jgi:hypothetical protein
LRRSVYTSRLQFSPKALTSRGEHIATKLVKLEGATAKRLRADMIDMYALHGAGMVVCEPVETPVRDKTKWRLTPKGRNWLIKQGVPPAAAAPEPPVVEIAEASVSDVARIMQMQARLEGQITPVEAAAITRLIARWVSE